MTKRSAAANAAPKQRVRGRPFPRGVSANPAGKRPGTRHRATVLAEQLMAGDLEAVVGKVVRQAKAGDMAAARLILDRVVPVRRGRPVQFALPPIKTPGDVVAALAAITAAVSAGRLTTDEAVAVAGVVELQRHAIKAVEHESRLAAIEERLGLRNER
jgi:hypothetical protein